MNKSNSAWLHAAGFLLAVLSSSSILASSRPGAMKVIIDGSGPDWQSPAEKDFDNINGSPDTWSWKDGLLKSTGKPIGVLCTRKVYTNFEFVAEWKHLRSGGNSGFFVWVPTEAITGLKPDVLPDSGIEIQVLDHGYTQQFIAETGEKADWFTTHGDVFPVKKSTMKPFQPTSPNGLRSFPRKHVSKGVGEWNHYYVRAINGEVRLWVNGEEVSGGNDTEPRQGHLCLEAEGSPIDFRNVHIRELP